MHSPRFQGVSLIQGFDVQPASEAADHLFEDAFLAVSGGETEDDVFNQLVLYGKANAGNNAAGGLELGFKAGWAAFSIVRMKFLPVAE